MAIPPRKGKGFMASLSDEKRLHVLAGLVNGNSIRAVSRMTDVHQDTIGRFALRLGEGAQRLHDRLVRDLACAFVDLDEQHSWCGKRQVHVVEVTIVPSGRCTQARKPMNFQPERCSRGGRHGAVCFAIASSFRKGEGDAAENLDRTIKMWEAHVPCGKGASCSQQRQLEAKRLPTSLLAFGLSEADRFENLSPRSCWQDT